MKSLESLEQTIADKRDKLLIKTTLSGDKKSFSILFSFYKKRVSALGMSFFKNETEVEDFTQEVFIKIYKNLENFKGESLFSTWLTRIALNTAINAKNRNAEYSPIANEEKLVSKISTPEENEIRNAVISSVRESVKDLPEKYAICVELYFFYDNSYEEITKITGISMNNVKSNIFRAKKMLKEKLKPLYEK